MNNVTDGQYTAFIGIDWADTKHDICLQAANNDQLEFDCIPHQVDRIEQWALSLRQRFGGPIAIALELSQGPIVYALQKYDFLVLFPINPSTLAFKWIRILYRCWQTRTPYDELTYLEALRRRGSPLLDHLGAAAAST